MFGYLIIQPLFFEPQILILIDALDEGDPPEQQVAGFKGDVMAGGNKALALVVRLLVEKLHSNFRYAYGSHIR